MSTNTQQGATCDAEPLTPAAEPVPGSPWTGRAAAGPNGASGTVRRVFRVEGIEIALLTDAAVARVWAEPVDLLATGGRAAAVADFAERWQELGRAEAAVFEGDAGQLARYRELSAALTPFTRARTRLRRALIEQAAAGDRVAYPLHGLLGTIVDPHSRPGGELRTDMLLRLDERHLREDPALRGHHRDGLLEVGVLLLWPTLGLL
ncbi:hypothetical protein [Streptacidiphilus sp. EB103A]|uniref:hypothetical protein n=1 Tax=Streptacidiphilus sp. EB103A TaxID=3156275 RepID=UPI0035184CB1